MSAPTIDRRVRPRGRRHHRHRGHRQRQLRQPHHHLRDRPPRQAGRRLRRRHLTATPCCCRPPRPAVSRKEQFDFFPLTVDVEERMYAAGRIPGSFFRREGRPSEDAILTCRLIDRPLRPTFAKGLRNEVQVVITVMALDPQHLYDVLAINGASASTQLSGLPFSGPVGGTRVALINGQWVGFPTHAELEDAVFDMVVAGRVLPDGDVAIMMVEAEATEKTIELIAGGATAPDRGGRGPGPRGRQAVHQGAVRRAGRARREGRQAGRRVPALPRLPGRRLRRRRGAGRRQARAGASRSPASTSARTPPTRSRTRSRPRWPASSRAARRRSPAPSAR